MQGVEITSDGRVLRRGKEKKLSVGNHGYYVCSIDNKTYLVHRLVAERYLINPDSKRTVNHKDGDRLNNNVENLEWTTDQENNLHSFKELGRKSGRLGKFKYSDEEVAELMLFNSLLGPKEVCRLSEIQKGSFRSLINRSKLWE